jgi:hypothetical protein
MDNTSTPADGGQASTSGLQGQAPTTSSGQAPTENPTRLTPEEQDILIKKLRKENTEARLKAKALEDAQKLADQEKQAAEQKRLAEEGRYKELADQAAARVQQLEAQILQEQQEKLRLKIGAKHGIPEELIGRLQGATEEEMTADALLLKKHIHQEVTVSVQQGNSPNPRPAGQMTPQQEIDALRERNQQKRGRLI